MWPHFALLSSRLVQGDTRVLPFHPTGDGSSHANESLPPNASTTRASACVARERLCMVGEAAMDPGVQVCLSAETMRIRSLAANRSSANPSNLSECQVESKAVQGRVYCGLPPSTPVCCMPADVDCVLPCGGYASGFCQRGEVLNRHKKTAPRESAGPPTGLWCPTACPGALLRALPYLTPD